MNTTNLTPGNIYGSFSAEGIMYAPCTINSKNWVLKIEGLNIEDSEKNFIDKFNMALSLNGGTIEGVQNSLNMNGFPCKIIGGVYTEDFSASIVELELDSNLY